VHEGVRPWRHIGIYRPEELSATLTGIESKWRHLPKMSSTTIWLGSFIMLFPSISFGDLLFCWLATAATMSHFLIAM
jgi:hypothetical protein